MLYFSDSKGKIKMVEMFSLLEKLDCPKFDPKQSSRAHYLQNMPSIKRKDNIVAEKAADNFVTFSTKLKKKFYPTVIDGSLLTC